MTDWTVLNINGVTDVAQLAAAKVARQYANTGYDDMYQEALIHLADHPDEVRGYINDPDQGLGYLHRWLWCDLVNTVKTNAKRGARHLSYELAREGAE